MRTTAVPPALRDDTTEGAVAPLRLSIVGNVRSQYRALSDCPPSAWDRPETSRIEVRPEFRDGLTGVQPGMLLFVLWVPVATDRAVLRTRQKDGRLLGVFAQRTPHRPNPLCLTMVRTVAVEPDALVVQGLECLDGTAVLDLKAAVCQQGGQCV